MRVLLTGASGFIAAHCLDQLLKEGYVNSSLSWDISLSSFTCDDDTALCPVVFV